MAWTRGDLKTEILNEVDDDTSDADTVVTQFIGDVCRDLWRRWRWSWRTAFYHYDTSAGDNTVDVSSDLSKFEAIHTIGYKGQNDTEYRPLIEMSLQEFQNPNRDHTTQSDPTHFLFIGDQMYLWLTPNATVTDAIEITADPKYVEMTSDSDVPPIPEKLKDVIKAGVKWKFWNYDDDLRAEEERVTYEGVTPGRNGGLIAQAIAADANQINAPKRIRLVR